MFARFLIGAVLAVGAALGAVTVIAVPGAAVACAVFGVVVAAVVGKRVRDIAPGDMAAKTWAGRRGGGLVGVVAAGGGLAVTGLVLVLGPASGPLLLLLASVTFAVWLWRQPDRRAALRTNPLPAVLDRVLRVVQKRPVPRAAAARPAWEAIVVGPPGPMPWSVSLPADLSTPQLCLAWQRTYFALLDLPAGASRGAIVRLRIGLLDEIERRDPEGFTRWLDTGARAGGDPGRYLAGDR